MEYKTLKVKSGFKIIIAINSEMIILKDITLTSTLPIQTEDEYYLIDVDEYKTVEVSKRLKYIQVCGREIVEGDQKNEVIFISKKDKNKIKIVKNNPYVFTCEDFSVYIEL